MTEEIRDNFQLDVVSVRLVKDAPIYSSNPFNTPEAVVQELGKLMCELDREVVCVINLKSNMIPINVSFVSMGTLNKAIIHPREILKTSILSNAAGIMLVHNHPTGNLRPSREDTMLTDRMAMIGKLMDIPLIDSIIVGGDNQEFFSFVEKGVMPSQDIKYYTDYKDIDIQNSGAEERMGFVRKAKSR